MTQSHVPAPILQPMATRPTASSDARTEPAWFPPNDSPANRMRRVGPVEGVWGSGLPPMLTYTTNKRPAKRSWVLIGTVAASGTPLLARGAVIEQKRTAPPRALRRTSDARRHADARIRRQTQAPRPPPWEAPLDATPSTPPPRRSPRIPDREGPTRLSRGPGRRLLRRPDRSRDPQLPDLRYAAASGAGQGHRDSQEGRGARQHDHGPPNQATRQCHRRGRGRDPHGRRTRHGR